MKAEQELFNIGLTKGKKDGLEDSLGQAFFLTGEAGRARSVWR
jgi:hypothetical protein